MAFIILRRAAIALAAYIAALLGILFLQFPNGNAFILSIGALKINGFERAGQEGASTPEAPLTVSADGISFFIEKEAPLIAVLDSGEEVVLEMRSFNKGERAFSVGFDRGVSLLFLADAEENGGGAAIQAKIPEGVSLIRLAYRLDKAPSLALGEPLIRGAGGFYVLEGARLEGGYSGVEGMESRVEIRAESPFVSCAKYEVIRDISLEAIGEDISASEEAYAQAIESFSQGIILEYQQATESGSLTQEIVAAFLAESARRGNLSAAAASLPASFLNSGDSSPLTAVYVGGIEAAWRQRMQDNERELSAYTANLEAQNPAVFETRGIAAFLISNRRSDDFRRLAELAALYARQEALTPRQAAGILELSLDRSLLPRSQTAIDNNTIATCEETIRKALRYFPAFSSAPSALYIEESSSAAPAPSALETAAILYRWGKSSEERADWAAAARLITITALNLAERGGFLPEAIAIPDPAGNSAAEADERAIPLAAVYPLIEPLSSWYPHAAVAYPRYSVWTCASDASISLSPEGVVSISVSFPTGQAHYMAISDVQSLYSLQMHGQSWGSDSRFESFSSSGYRHSASEGVIYLRLRHRTDRETIRILTSPPNAPAPAPAPAPVAERAPEPEEPPPQEEPQPQEEAVPERMPAALPVPAARQR